MRKIRLILLAVFVVATIVLIIFFYNRVNSFYKNYPHFNTDGPAQEQAFQDAAQQVSQSNLSVGVWYAVIWVGIAVVVVAKSNKENKQALEDYTRELERQEKRKEQERKERERIQVQQEIQSLSDATNLGTEKETFRPVAVSDVDRQSGTYLLGVQGVGKSSLVEQMIYQDAQKGHSIIVLDPHGDLIDHALEQLPSNRLKDTYLLDIEDTEFPFGLNLFSVALGANSTKEQQAHDRVLHVFEKCFPDTQGVLLEKYVGNIAPVFFANTAGGYGITDIPRFLRDDGFRDNLLKNVRFFVRDFWLNDYNSLSQSVRQRDTASLATRINRFVRSPIVGNIIGQGNTTIDFRKAIEEKQIIFIKLPVKTLKEDASLIGTMLVAQIHAAIFSFGDLPLEKRPGFSLYVDEFQHFATSDFSEMFTEGRKFGSRVTVAHQFIGQLPKELASATTTAYTKVCFQTTTEDAPKMGHLFIREETKIRAEDIDTKPVEYIMEHGHDSVPVKHFINQYLREVQKVKKGNRIEITLFSALNGTKTVEVFNPFPTLDALLYEVMKKGSAHVPLSLDMVYGFSKCGNGFYKRLKALTPKGEQLVTSADTFASQASAYQFKALIGDTAEDEQLYDFLATLHQVMKILAEHPIGKMQAKTASEVAQEIINLPRRTAFARIGKNIRLMQTNDTPVSVGAGQALKRKQAIIEQTHIRYCKPRAIVEREIEARQRDTGITKTAPAAPMPLQEDANGNIPPVPRKRALEVDDDI